MKLTDLLDYCENLLACASIRDYCPNGLQVESCRDVSRIASSVTASLDAIEKAADEKADVLLVHHGFFWKGEAGPLSGMKGRRVRRLFAANINLLAYHLPLDKHPQLGNNRQLAEQLGIMNARPLADDSDMQGLLWQGDWPQALTQAQMAGHIAQVLGREPLVLGKQPASIRTLAWCTGAAQSYIQQAAELGVDAFISGEVSEQTLHQANELGLLYFAAGHHATERYGVRALGEHLAKQFDVEHVALELDNPV
ncbi:MAG: Nif3-like dinuclear metal center hexameric protein [gamma proteobacterium symbiont of Bathyaustriella thionipta]|nr:Nif3-like dinuclear metal center hexameric protein [gamma proteobacterium symbiont of Bathyaustriella thionipta]